MEKPLDAQEYHIVEQLIRDPRRSDNEISRRTGIPLPTVNRKRKSMEKRGLLSYFTYLHTFTDGLDHFGARCLVTLKFGYGFTRKLILDVLDSKDRTIAFNSKHILESHIGESDGRVAWVMIVESMRHADIVEIINAEIIPQVESIFGKGAVVDSTLVELSATVRVLHNYLPRKNMKGGRINDNWDSRFIYVT